MGHYRSEMGYEDQDERDRKEAEDKLQRQADKLKELIAKEGLERALVIAFEPRIGKLGW